MWNRWQETEDFPKRLAPETFRSDPVLSREADELHRLREDFPAGKFKLEIAEETFTLRRYQKFLANISDDAASFRNRQQEAFDEERERWALTGSADGQPRRYPKRTLPKPRWKCLRAATQWMLMWRRMFGKSWPQLRARGRRRRHACDS